VSTGQVVECGDKRRPVVWQPLVDLDERELVEIVFARKARHPGEEQVVATGVERPEGWCYP
jgi:hypothetical protein